MSRNLDRRSFMAVSAGGTLLAALPVVARAQGKLGKVEYGVASIDPLYSAAYVALKRDLFKQQGLEVNYLNTQSGPRSKQLLAAGQIGIATSGVNDAIALNLAGKDTTVIYGFDQRVPFANIMVRKADFDSGKIKSVKDLAGKTIAVTQPQSATWLMATYISDRAGILKQVNIRGLGDFATMMGAVKAGQVDATIATISMLDSAKQQGWGHTLFDVTDEGAWKETFGGNVPGVGCYVLQESLKTNGEALQAFVTAMAKAQDVLNSSTPEQIVDGIFDAYLTGYEREATLRAVRVYKAGVWSRNNDVSNDAYTRLIGIMGDGRQFSNAELEAVPYKKVVDMSFLSKAKR
ncbi:MAG: ABC transporter substrate-binding protein [Burkholderiales bacterium]|nr:ABC transporter substrate-binding protein [Burkholderiales bacterium]